MHLADTFIQSDLYNSGYTFFVSICSLEIEPMTFCAANAMLFQPLKCLKAKFEHFKEPSANPLPFIVYCLNSEYFNTHTLALFTSILCASI